MTSVRSYFYDPEREIFVNERGAAVNVRPSVAYCDFQRWSLRLQTGEGDSVTPFAMPDDVISFTMAIDRDKKEATTPLIRATNDMITISPDRSSLDFTVDAATNEAKTALDGQTGSAAGYFELCGLDANARRVLRISFAVDLRGAVDPSGLNHPTPGLPAVADLPAETPDGAYMRQMLGGVRSWVKGVLSVAWDSITGKPSAFPPLAHAHAQSDITDLSASLSGKANASHTHNGSDIHSMRTPIAPSLAYMYPVVQGENQVEIQEKNGKFFHLSRDTQAGLSDTALEFYAKNITQNTITLTIYRLGKKYTLLPQKIYYVFVDIDGVNHIVRQIDSLESELALKAPVPAVTTPENNALAWNGTQFVNVPAGGGGSVGIADAPVDGHLYGRSNGAWVRALPESKSFYIFDASGTNGGNIICVNSAVSPDKWDVMNLGNPTPCVSSRGAELVCALYGGQNIARFDGRALTGRTLPYMGDTYQISDVIFGNKCIFLTDNRNSKLVFYSLNPDFSGDGSYLLEANCSVENPRLRAACRYQDGFAALIAPATGTMGQTFGLIYDDGIGSGTIGMDFDGIDVCPFGENIALLSASGGVYWYTPHIFTPLVDGTENYVKIDLEDDILYALTASGRVDRYSAETHFEPFAQVPLNGEVITDFKMVLGTPWVMVHTMGEGGLFIGENLSLLGNRIGSMYGLKFSE